MSDGDQIRLEERGDTNSLVLRLGRHINHDPRSRAFRAPADGVTPQSKVWKRHTGPYDQSNYYDQKLRKHVSLGSCTGNAVAGLVMTDPVWHPGLRVFQPGAVRIYKRATVLDPWDGFYPYDDTGSDGLSACKAAVEFKYAAQYLWGFGIDDMMRILTALGPVAVGTNWLSGMDAPDEHGVVSASGMSRGGHEYQVVGIHFDTSLGAPRGEVFECQQSWGPDWGVRGTDKVKGRFYVTFADMGMLLDDGGDVVTLSTSKLVDA